MNTITASLTWEYLARNRWMLPLPFLLAVAVAMLILLPLKSLEFSVDSRELIGLQLVLLWSFVLIIIAGVFESLGSLKALYSKPISTAGMVSYFFWGGAFLVAVQVALLIAICRSLLGADWPFTGPILFAVVLWSWTQLLFRVTMRTLWWIPTSLVIYAALLFWSMIRHGIVPKEGGMIASSVHYWSTLTGQDVAIALASLLATFSLTTWRVNCDRSGRSNWPTLVSARKRWAPNTTERVSILKTFHAGQAAYEWFDFKNRNGSFAQVVLAGLLMAWFTALAIYPFSGDALISLRTALGGTFLVEVTQFVAAIFLVVAAMKGYSAQDYRGLGREQGRPKPIPLGISQFVKALPISTQQIAAAILRSSARAVGFSGIYIFSSFVLLGVVGWGLGDRSFVNDSEFNYWKLTFAISICSTLLSFVFLNLTCLYSPRKVSGEHWIPPLVIILNMLTLWSPIFPFVSLGAAGIALVGLVFATIQSVKRVDISLSNAVLLWLAGSALTAGLIFCLPSDSKLTISVLVATLVMLALLPCFSTTSALRHLRTN